MNARARLLVVDDEPALRGLLTEALAGWGHEVAAAATRDEAIELVGSQLFEAVVLDLHLGADSGVEVLREIRTKDLGLDVVIVTGYPTVETAVEALRAGAADYLTKPVNLEELRHVLGRVLERRRLCREVRELRQELGVHLSDRELLGASPAMQRVKAMLLQVAANDASVLIEGESGTGKELAAAMIHRESPRRRGPFIPVNCGAIPADLLESEFFGHVRGAFSGAVADTLGLFRSAHGGTLFLDEVGEVPLALQSKLLRAVQEREVRPVGAAKSVQVDVRLIAATNRNLELAVRDGQFRQDLFYRLNVVQVEMPPLRERPEDLPALVQHILERLNARAGRTVQGLTPEAMAALRAHDFPGNVRELENVLERAYAFGVTPMIGPADLPVLGRPEPTPPAAPVADLPTMAEMERELITRALQVHGGDRLRAARALGISDRTIYRRLKDYRLL